jgi:alanine-glyoxylate transaminase/serine-glyoxylate transaminase/serine-pyruvate transaminase
MVPSGFNGADVIDVAFRRYDLALGAGLARMAGKLFRIGHLGDLNELMLLDQGLECVFARHARHSEATRRAVRAWGLEILCADPAAYSDSLTAVMLPHGHREEELRRVILENFDMSLGAGLGKLAGRVVRIGHLGSFNDLMLMATLSGFEMGLDLARVPHHRGGAQAALDYLTESARLATTRARSA